MTRAKRRLPGVEASESPRPRKSKSPARRSPAAPRPGSLHILVVENHPDMRLGLEVFLKLLGHRVRFAHDAAAALALASEETFDLLLSDISLPDGDGWQLLRQLEAAGHRPARAVAMSGLGSATDLAKSRAAGFVAHLIKPFQPEELEAALRLPPPLRLRAPE